MAVMCENCVMSLIPVNIALHRRESDKECTSGPQIATGLRLLLDSSRNSTVKTNESK